MQLEEFEGGSFKYDYTILDIFFFREILRLVKLEGDDFKYYNIFFKILAQKYPNQAFLVQNVSIFFFFYEILQIGKFKSADLRNF